MRNSFALAGISGLMTLSACATAGDSEPVVPPLGTATCNADPVQDLLGQTANQELAASAMVRSGAQTLRWIPPNSAVTMDFRPERLNISFDENSIVTDINCG